MSIIVIMWYFTNLCLFTTYQRVHIWGPKIICPFNAALVIGTMCSRAAR